MLCFHKYIKADNGDLYCERCGKVIVPPCNHDWILIKDIEIKDNRWGFETRERLPFYIRTYECSKCKSIKNERIE